MTTCPRCGRPEWLDGPIGVATCEYTGGVTCRLAAQRNALVAALGAVVRTPHDPTVVRTGRAVLEYYVPPRPPTAPTPGDCPECSAKYAMNKVHFAKPSDARPCAGSYPKVKKVKV